METEKLKALKDSIEKWERLTKIECMDDVQIGPDECPLCVLYNNEENVCKGCPVFEKTGQIHCEGTPYHMVETMYYDWRDDDGYYTDEISYIENFKYAAKAELKFLKSLLPEGEK